MCLKAHRKPRPSGEVAAHSADGEGMAFCTNNVAFCLCISTIKIETDLKLFTNFAPKTTICEENKNFLCAFGIISISSAELYAPHSLLTLSEGGKLCCPLTWMT